MLVQIEVTTVCNYSCFYCCGRDMTQQHMPLERFERVLNALPESGLTINLQGEGEPFLHPQFDEILRITAERGFRPYAITNGTRLPPELIKRYFPALGISIDTLDAALAERIGRVNLPKVLRNLERLLAEGYPPERIVVHTVQFGQKPSGIRRYLAGLGIRRHIVQPLQVKDDYSYRYAAVAPPHTPVSDYRCRYIDEPRMLFFNIDGTAMPCCFIKRPEQYVSREQIAAALGRREVPDCCAGCRELR